MIRPLSTPSATARVNMRTSARAGVMPSVMKPKKTQVTRPSIDPTDRSIPPLEITKVIPIAMIT